MSTSMRRRQSPCDGFSALQDSSDVELSPRSHTIMRSPLPYRRNCTTRDELVELMEQRVAMSFEAPRTIPLPDACKYTRTGCTASIADAGLSGRVDDDAASRIQRLGLSPRVIQPGLGKKMRETYGPSGSHTARHWRMDMSIEPAGSSVEPTAEVLERRSARPAELSDEQPPSQWCSVLASASVHHEHGLDTLDAFLHERGELPPSLSANDSSRGAAKHSRGASPVPKRVSLASAATQIATQSSFIRRTQLNAIDEALDPLPTRPPPPPAAGAAARPRPLSDSSKGTKGEVHDVRLSKLLSKLLRHTAIEFSVKIDGDGWVPLSDACHHVNQLAILHRNQLHSKRYTEADIREMVCLNDKQRFELNEDGPNGAAQIRATYKHSVPLAADSTDATGNVKKSKDANKATASWLEAQLLSIHAPPVAVKVQEPWETRVGSFVGMDNEQRQPADTALSPRYFGVGRW